MIHSFYESHNLIYFFWDPCQCATDFMHCYKILPVGGCSPPSDVTGVLMKRSRCLLAIFKKKIDDYMIHFIGFTLYDSLLPDSPYMIHYI